MEKARKLFFQILLIILALIFILCVRFAYESQSAPTGTFASAENNNVTLSQIFSQKLAAGESVTE